jgi:hypothetical protein
MHFTCIIVTRTEIWSKTTLPVTRFKNWSNSLRTTICSGEQDSNSGYLKLKIQLCYNALNLRIFTRTNWSTNFLLLQFTGPQPWYGLYHSSDVFEDKLSCVVFMFDRPVENVIRETVNATGIRLVHITNYLLTAILRR